jgi:peptide deformylase
MPRLPILEFPDPRLRTVARAVSSVDARIRRLADDMLETMYAADGIGLAATQVNQHVRLIVVDISPQRNAPLVLINPTLSVDDATEVEAREGCLSVPGFHEPVTRAAGVRIDALDRDGKTLSLHADGLLAQCVQHECDHLQGKLFVDYLSALKRSRIRSRLTKQQRQPA